MQQKKKKVELTIPQISAVLSKQPKKFFEWGRGSGKSTLLGYFTKELVKQMPRASFGLVGSTYSQILSRTLPSTIEGMEMFGLYQDVDYVIGRSGKKQGFEMPFQPPNQWNNIIHFSNGAIFQLVSLDNPNTGRGLNSYAIEGDEAALLDPEKLYNNVKTTNRAKKDIFKNSPLLGAEIYASSTPLTKKGKWFIENEALARSNPEKYYFSKANALSNPNLRKEWFEEMRLESPSQMLYEAEILNIRPREITNGFYGNIIPDVHYYTDYDNGYLESIVDFKDKTHYNCLQDNDVLRHKPLIMSFDFGLFNCCVVSQLNDDQYNILKSFWVKSPKLLTDMLVEDVLPYYYPHPEKIVYLYGGHDGHVRIPNSNKTLFQQIEEIFLMHGWKVITLAKANTYTHHEKYICINALLKGYNRLPKIRINEHNNKDLIIALEHTEAREGKSGIEKNKSDERNKSFAQEHAPHLTDAFDHPVMALFYNKFKGKSDFTEEFRIG